MGVRIEGGGFTTHETARLAGSRALTEFRFWRAPSKGGAFQWVQAPPGNRYQKRKWPRWNGMSVLLSTTDIV